MAAPTASRSRIGRIGAICLSAALAGGVGAVHSYWTDTALFLEIEAKSSVPSIAQVFYDTGRGFNEKDSQAIHVAAAGVYQFLEFPLPHKPIRQLRFDPLTGPGTMVVHRISVFDGAHRQIAAFRPDALQPANETRVVPVLQGALIETVANARDPITIIPLVQPLASPVDVVSDAIERGLVWLLAGILAALVLTAPAVHRHWAPRLHDLIRVLSSDPSEGNSLARRDRIVLVAALNVITLAHIIRAPRLFVDPRFWAEEGSVWFQYAATHSFGATLVFIFNDSGYLTLFINISAALASTWRMLFGPEYAPLVTTLCALFVQLLCFVFILTGRSRLAGQWWKRMLVSAVVLFSPVAVGEIWLNTINSPSYLGLITVLILFQDPQGWTVRARWTVRALLVLCGLTGVYSAVLSPVFVFAFVLYKCREHLYQAAVLALCLCVQIGSALLVRSGSGLEHSRFSQVTLDSALINAFFNHILVPLTGPSGARTLLHWFGMDNALAGAIAVPRGPELLLGAWFSFVLTMLVLVTVSKRITREKLLLLVCFLLYSALTTVASLNGLPGGRYAYLPGTALLLLLLLAAETAPVRVARAIGALVLTHFFVFRRRRIPQ